MKRVMKATAVAKSAVFYQEQCDQRGDFDLRYCHLRTLALHSIAILSFQVILIIKSIVDGVPVGTIGL